jgi:hypothetical protein
MGVNRIRLGGIKNDGARRTIRLANAAGERFDKFPRAMSTRGHAAALCRFQRRSVPRGETKHRNVATLKRVPLMRRFASRRVERTNACACVRTSVSALLVSSFHCPATYVRPINCSAFEQRWKYFTVKYCHSTTAYRVCIRYLERVLPSRRRDNNLARNARDY